MAKIRRQTNSTFRTGPWIGWRLIMAALLMLPLGTAASAQDGVNGTTEGWSWQASSTGFNVAPPRGQLTVNGRIPDDVQLDLHLLYEPSPSYYHHFRFLKGGPLPKTVFVQFDDHKKVEHSISGANPDGIFIPEEGEISAAKYPASTAARRIRYELRYADGTRKTYVLDTKGYLKAFAAGERASDNLFEDEIDW